MALGYVLAFVLIFLLIALSIAARSEQGAPPAVAGKDILMAVLEDDAHKTSLHYQPSPNCMEFLSAFMKHEREGVPTFLTFQTPPHAHGKVLAAFCVRPNGEIVCSKPVGNIQCKQGDF
jgi:hypothetical protein